MPNPKVLTTGSVINCPHLPGNLQFTGVDHKLKVQGNPVLVKTDILQAAVNGCPNIPPPSTRKQCTKVSSFIQGEATKLKVGGVPVMLHTLAALTDGLPPPPPPLPPPGGNLTVAQVQSKLTAV
jgi:hypothetical protein